MPPASSKRARPRRRQTARGAAARAADRCRAIDRARPAAPPWAMSARIAADTASRDRRTPDRQGARPPKKSPPRSATLVKAEVRPMHECMRNRKLGRDRPSSASSACSPISAPIARSWLASICAQRASSPSSTRRTGCAKEAQALLAEFERKGREAESEAAAIIAGAKAEAERLAAEAKAKMEDFVARRTKMAEAKIVQAEAQALADVRAAASDAAVAAAEKILAAAAKGKVAEDLLSRASRRAQQSSTEPPPRPFGAVLLNGVDRRSGYSGFNSRLGPA